MARVASLRRLIPMAARALHWPLSDLVRLTERDLVGYLAAR